MEGYIYWTCQGEEAEVVTTEGLEEEARHEEAKEDKRNSESGDEVM